MPDLLEELRGEVEWSNALARRYWNDCEDSTDAIDRALLSARASLADECSDRLTRLLDRYEGMERVELWRVHSPHLTSRWEIGDPPDKAHGVEVRTALLLPPKEEK